MKLQWMLITAIAFLGCSKVEEPFTNEELKDDLQFKGRISGKVTDLEGLALAGVSVTAIPEGYFSKSDSLGQYTLPGVKGGVYDLEFRFLNYADTSISNLEVEIDEDVKNVDVSMRKQSDSGIVEIIENLQNRDVVGILNNTTQIASVELHVMDSANTQVKVGLASWESSSNQFTAKLDVSKQGGTLIIVVLDENNLRIGESRVKFDESKNQIIVPEFSATNALPIMQVSLTPVESTPKDSITLEVQTTDSIGPVVFWEYKWGDQEYIKVGNQGSEIKLLTPDTAKDIDYWVRVTDQDSNKVVMQKTYTGMDQDIPTGFIKGALIAEIGTQILLEADVKDGKGTIDVYEWDLGTGVFALGDSVITFEGATVGEYLIRLRVKDDDDNQPIFEIKVNVFSSSDKLTDPRDGKQYLIVNIGTQTWMATNLNYGTMALDDGSRGLLQASETKFCYANTNSNCELNGGLYQWHVAMNLSESCAASECKDSVDVNNHPGICPLGWRIPSEKDWDELKVELGGPEIAGKKMKLNGTAFPIWNDTLTNDGNSSGFSAIPSGMYEWSGGVEYNFKSLGQSTIFWSADEVSSNLVASNSLYNGSGIAYNDRKKAVGIPVRCLKI